MIYYEVITKKNMPQYRDVMLPVAYEEIASLEMEPIEMGYLCIGARDDKSQKTAGSIVATLGEDDGEGTITVQSLFVRQKNRRKEVGSTLLTRLLTVCSDIYQFPEGVDSAPVTLKLQYALPDPDAEVFTAFLMKFGVTDFAEEAPVFRMSEWDLMQLDMLHPESKGNPKVRPFSEAGDELIGEINALNIDGMPAVTHLNALVGSFVNLAYPLPNGTAARFLDDSATYLGTQLAGAENGKYFGILTNADFILICTYGENAADPELLLYKKR